MESLHGDGGTETTSARFMDFTLGPNWGDCGGKRARPVPVSRNPMVREPLPPNALPVGPLGFWEIGHYLPSPLKCDSSCFVAFTYMCDKSVGTEGWMLAVQPALHSENLKEPQKATEKNLKEP